VLGLVDRGAIPLATAIERLTAGPARVLGLAGGSLAEGAVADLTMIDLDQRWTVDPESMRSKSRNTPFAGWALRGKAVLTMVGGRVLFEEGAR
jgi:dihydroorotase